MNFLTVVTRDKNAKTGFLPKYCHKSEQNPSLRVLDFQMDGCKFKNARPGLPFRWWGMAADAEACGQQDEAVGRIFLEHALLVTAVMVHPGHFLGHAAGEVRLVCVIADAGGVWQ
jgi:hypothetical protein